MTLGGGRTPGVRDKYDDKGDVWDHMLDRSTSEERIYFDDPDIGLGWVTVDDYGSAFLAYSSDNFTLSDKEYVAWIYAWCVAHGYMNFSAEQDAFQEGFVDAL